MHPTFVCSSLLALALGLTVASPMSAQRIDTRFGDLDASGSGPSGFPATEPSRIPVVGQASDSTDSGSGPSIVGMTILTSMGSVAGSVLGIMYAAGTDADPFDEGAEPYLAAATFGALGSIPGSALGAWLSGRDAGVGFGGALLGATLGLGSGIVLEAGTGGASFPAAFVVGQSITTVLVARAFAD